MRTSRHAIWIILVILFLINVCLRCSWVGVGARLAAAASIDDDADATQTRAGAATADASPEPTATIDPTARGGTYVVQTPVTLGGDKLQVLVAETFQDEESTVFERWVRSTADEYTGVWAVGGGKRAALVGDKALIVTRKALKYGIAQKTDSFDLNAKPFVVQYEVRHEDGHTCSGAYLKLLTKPFGTDVALEKLSNSEPYSIMFGPDKCGETNKVHFIFQSVDPKSGKKVEHHLRNAPTMPHAIGSTHLYTLMVDPATETYKVLVDNELKRSGSLREDFDPPVEPPKEIDDPKDKKPSDWVDEKMIPDPAATKPADWDENAPRQIPDPKSTKPPGWLDDEPKLVPDSDAVKPAAWDDEEDGEWKPPMIPNPKCANAPGCGEWKPSMIPNPAYRGKWKAPLIPNPAYKGPWKPRKIANPDYYRVDKVQFLPITAVGIEIWTMDQGIAFDNILLLSGTNALQAAEDFAVQTWVKKAKVEKELEQARKPLGKDERNELGPLRTKLLDVVESALGYIELLVDAIDQGLARVGLQEPVHKTIELFQRQPMLLAALLPPLIVSIMLVVTNMMGRKGLSRASAAQRADALRKKDDEPEGEDRAAGAKSSRMRASNAANRIPTESQKESLADDDSDEVMDEDADEDSGISAAAAAATGGALRRRTSRARKADE
ncbi:hypothetical protein F1559_003228 [Cyanidiococcus yangmingshanensis]|uniref:Calnexin n=1 Tax=Cyanidiococcus yangmingshanensis TaxID=2690220 RepID=A0A7J7IGL2_9RHOD|nr:hypothetical protein F1559_003228 [Cyanidiococcus yangmingshanensis]